MTALVLPTLDLYDSWAECVAEYAPGDLHGSGIWNLPEALQHDTDRDTCEALVALLRRMGREWDPTKVPSDYWWITEGDEVIGFLAIRHRLNDFLLDVGGHIGYSVRPSRRRQGHATRALGLARERAGELGIERALVTCDDDNLASAGTIEAQGGRLEDVRNGKRRYWLATARREGDRAEIARLVDLFFDAFRTGADLDERMDALRTAMLDGAIIVQTCGAEPTAYDVEAFLAPRRTLLTEGRLTEFTEHATGGRIDVFGDIAQWFGGYAKSGVLDGAPYAGRGAKSIQLARTAAGWRISAVAWDDER